jgi:hypothetical protein
MRFMASLYVKVLDGPSKSKFSFQSRPEEHVEAGVNLARDDMLQNFSGINDVAMNGNSPWRGPREKAISTMKMLVQATTSPGDIVLDCTASTGLLYLTICPIISLKKLIINFSSLSLLLILIVGHPQAALILVALNCENDVDYVDPLVNPFSVSTGATIYACRATRRHIVALEADKAIFNALLAPFIATKPIIEAIPAQSIAPALHLDDEEVPIRQVVKTSKFSK